MLAGTDDHLTWLSPVILNLENMGLTHLESEIRVKYILLAFLSVLKFSKGFIYTRKYGKNKILLKYQYPLN